MMETVWATDLVTLRSVFEAIFISSLYAAVTGIAILILKQLLGNKISPRWHYLIWIVLIAKLLIPFGPESEISLFNAVPQASQSSSPTESYSELRSNAITAMQNTLRSPARFPKNTVNTKNGSSQSLLPIEAPKTAFSFVSEIEAIAPIIWLTGMFLFLIWLVLTGMLLHLKIKNSGKPAPQHIDAILQESKRKVNVLKNVEIVIQNIIGTPSLFGILKPKILLTPNAIKRSSDELSYIFLHELAHLKRRDLQVNYLLLALQAVHWFNPVVWYCFRKIRQDMETAADEKVLSQLENSEHTDYGMALLAILESFNTLRFAPKLIGMIDEKKNIERRVRMIKMASLFAGKKRFITVVGLICVFILSGCLLTNAVSKNNTMMVSLLDYSFSIPRDWVAMNGKREELMFENNHKRIGGIKIINYNPGKPVEAIFNDQNLYQTSYKEPDYPYGFDSIPKYSIIAKRDVAGLTTKAVLCGIHFNAKANQTAPSKKGMAINENHLFLLFPKDKIAYDIHVNTKYVDENQLLKIAESATPYEGYNAKELLKYKTKYVGNNSKVGNILTYLPFANVKEQFSLKTDKEPYGVTVDYVYGHGTISEKSYADLKKTMQNNAAVMFSLIDNVDRINFVWTTKGAISKTDKEALRSQPALQGCECHRLGEMKKTKQVVYTYTREQIQQRFQKDLREYSKDERTFEEFLGNIKAQDLSDSTMFAGSNPANNKSKPILKLYAEPKNYSPLMSSTPGIKISAKLEGAAERVRYTATEGFFETFDYKTGVVGEGNKNYIEAPMSQAVYWSPVPTSPTGKPSLPSSSKKEVSVKAEALIGLLKVTEQELIISSSDSIYYTVEDAPNVITKEAGGVQQMSSISFNGGEFSYPSSWAKGKDYVQDKTTGKTIIYSSKSCSEKELNSWINGEIKRKLLATESSNTLRQPLSKEQKEPGLTEYGYAIGSKMDSNKEVLLKTTVFYNGKTRYEFQSALPPVANVEYENIVGSFRLVSQ